MQESTRLAIPRLLIVILGVVCAAPAAAQNLAQNHGFEATPNGCPNNLGQLPLAAPWFNPTAASPDFFHACGPPVIDVPDNFCGSQWGADGAAYGGFIAFDPSSEYHEYLANPFQSPMVAGETYEVRFWVSLADDSQRAIGAIGAHLTSAPVGPFATNEVLNFVPQIEHDASDYLTDKDAWMKVREKITAAGGEDKIVIGNFNNNFDTPSVAVGGGNPSHPFAYYYVDLLYVYRVDIGDIGAPARTTAGFGPEVLHIKNMPPLAPVTIYWSDNLEGTLVNGQLFDLGPPLRPFITGRTDAAGSFTHFVFPSARSWHIGGGQAREVYVEARVDDPVSGATYDTNPLVFRAH